MLRPRWRKVLTDLWSNKIRSLLVVASIAVGLYAVGMITSMHVIITSDMETGFEAVNPANIEIFASSFDQDLVDHIRHLPGVRQAEAVRIVTLRVRNSDGEWEPIDIKAIPIINEMQIDQVRLEQGIWPPGKHQIVVDGYKLGNLPVGVGGSLEIELPSGKVRHIPLVGVINDQTIGSTGRGGFFLAPIEGYITLETLEWLESPDTFNRLYVTVEGDSNDLEHIRAIANRVSDEVKKTGLSVYSTAIRTTNNHPNRVYVQAIASVLLVLGFLVMFLSTFLITNTLSALLNQQVHQIGVMKTIGARRGQIIGIYMVLIFAYGLVAFLIALPLASHSAYLLLQTFASAINVTLQGYRTVPLAVYLMLIIALLIPEIAGFLPILHGTRISAVEALSGYSQAHPPSMHGWLDRQLHKLRGLPRPMLLSLRNTFRRKGRLFLTVLTLTLGGAIFIATFNAQRSLASYIARIGRYFLADVNLTTSRYYRISEIQDVVGEVPGVGAVEGWASTAAELVMPDGTTGESFAILGPPVDSKLVEPVVREGRWLVAGDENAIAVNERFRETFPDLQVGDTITARIAGSKKELVVVGFFQLAGKSSGYLAYSTYDYLSQAAHETRRANTFRVTADHPGLTLEEQKALGLAIEAHLKERGYQVSEITAGLSLTAKTADGLNILLGFLLIMASLIAIVGSIGLTGTMSMNVLERTREIGIIRSIGASDRAVMNMVMVEGMLIGLMSWVFGILMAFPISSLLSNAINLALFGVPADFIFTPLGVILWLGVVLILSALASVLPARNAAHLTIQEVLAYE
jgi:putative ABC transport system permease protein